MKKGFTLIELAIVLVVIGLLIGMAFKGKSLVEAAKAKSEIAKMQNIATGLSVYIAKYGILPGMNGPVTSPDGAVFQQFSSSALYQGLVAEGVLKAGDFKTSTGSNLGLGYWWFIGCKEDTNSWSYDTLSVNTNICIYRSNAEPTKYAAPKNFPVDPGISAINICQIETMLDDKNLTTGDGRLAKGSSAPKIDNVNWDCTNNGNKNDAATSGTVYLYRVF